MRKFLIFLSVVFIFFGCSDKVVIHEPLKNELLAYTSKFEAVDKENRVLVLGTYLNPVHSELISETKDEKFIIAVHPKESRIDLANFSINGSKEGVRARILPDNDPLLSLVTFQMPWGKHIEVISPEKTGDNLTLEFEIYPSVQASLKFRKVSKSMYWN